MVQCTNLNIINVVFTTQFAEAFLAASIDDGPVRTWRWLFFWLALAVFWREMPILTSWRGRRGSPRRSLGFEGHPCDKWDDTVDWYNARTRGQWTRTTPIELARRLQPFWSSRRYSVGGRP